MPLHPNATQCAYTKPDGRRCGGPAVHDSNFCHHHDGLQTRLRQRDFRIPALDDQNSIQVAIMDVVNALLTNSIQRADAYTIIYALQIARNNLKGLTLSPMPPDELEALLTAARKEARDAGFTDGYEKARTTADKDLRAAEDRHRKELRKLEERHQKELERREREESEKGESLAAYLLRELREPQCDASGEPLRDAAGNRLYYTPEETQAREAARNPAPGPRG